jgi:DNA processing protein
VEQTLDLLTITLLPGVGPRTARALCGRRGLGDLLAHPQSCEDLLPAGALRAIRSGAARRRAEAEMDRAVRANIRIVGCEEPDYPVLLRRIYDPPPVLYVRGALGAEEGSSAVAIVGARAASPQGCALATSMAADLARSGVTVVSGLARGIDSAAHRGALAAGGRTVAVLGSGLDRVYPRENEPLADAIAAAGAVVSEFPLGTDPRPGNFPRRNRLIAGWGRAVVVVEAAERSGALVTARAALEEGREVMAVPGHPSHPLSAGVNSLIRDGAALVRDARDIAQEAGFVIDVTENGGRAADDVLGSLRRDAPSTIEEIQAKSGRPIEELLQRLSELELAARVRRLPGALFVRN